MPRAVALFDSPAETEAAFYDCLERGDLDGLMELWADDEEVVCIHPGGNRLVGHDEIRASWGSILSNGGSLRIRPTALHTHQSLMLAVHNLIEEVVITGAGSEGLIQVLATNVYSKGRNGWRMVLHHACPAGEAPDESNPLGTTLH